MAGVAYRSGNMLFFGASLVVLVPAMAALAYLSVPRWGGMLQQRVVQWLYAQEGSVAFLSKSEKPKVWGPVLAACFAICIAASVMLNFSLDMPSKYMQPISALCVVPFLVSLWFLMRPTVGYSALLWPLLYATHAILIVSGSPILFTHPWDGLNILIPIAGYGMLSGLVGHLYSRVALRQLKSLTRTHLIDSDTTEK